MNSVALRVPQASGMYLEVQDGFVRQSHLAPPVVAPDSPRPQKAATATGFKSHVLNPTEGFKRDDRV
uniref:Uncharacterized protein n=1 Tax=Acrobeloides nanus TaxID=290746 RepID=A0A914CZS4_9BILA